VRVVIVAGQSRPGATWRRCPPLGGQAQLGGIGRLAVPRHESHLSS
jgi:hypothetical protein